MSNKKAPRPLITDNKPLINRAKRPIGARTEAAAAPVTAATAAAAGAAAAAPRGPCQKNRHKMAGHATNRAITCQLKSELISGCLQIKSD